ncbi:hypothetical protein [Nocardioides gansuensis]|uniref:hypothetical protein n=1 Tax=Nocardioides gansuensis TaxID=2138300 RepID=UPI001402C4C3
MQAGRLDDEMVEAGRLWQPRRPGRGVDGTGDAGLGLIEGLCAMAELQTGPFAARTRARYALFLELAGDPELGEPLRRQRREFERWTERIVVAVGIAEPVPATRALMALADGLLLHRLTVDPDLDMRPAIERAVRALAES